MLSGEQIERYEVLGELATGGMATVYLGRQRGPFGFTRTVAIKSMHPQYAKDERFRAMFLDEATLTAKIRHPNVVPTVDVVCSNAKLLLVMDYVDGVSLATLLRRAASRQMPIPASVIVAIVCDTLRGLHAAHELVDDEGARLDVIHRDVSPQNVLVGADGLARILDFGVAKAATQRSVTETNEIKGKLAYMAPEQICGEVLDRRVDVYAAGVVLWEGLTLQRLFRATNEGALIKRIVEGQIVAPSTVAEGISPELDAVVMSALATERDGRWASAAELADALAEAVRPAARSAVTELVRELAGEDLATRSRRLRRSPPANDDEAKLVEDLLSERAVTSTMLTAPLAPASRWGGLAIAAAVIALTGGAFFVGLRASETPPPESGAWPAPSARVTPPAIASATPSASASIELTPSVKPQPTPSAAPVVSGRPSHTRPPAPPAPTSSKPGIDCGLPYTIDADGD